MAEINVEYPCGFKMHIKAGMFDMVSGELGDRNGCPLHGKNCKRK